MYLESVNNKRIVCANICWVLLLQTLSYKSYIKGILSLESADIYLHM